MPRRIIITSFLFVFVLKALSVYYLTSVNSCEHGSDGILGFWSIKAGDTRSYIQPAENLLQTGTYFEINEVGETLYAGRMPYYGCFYLAFRMFLTPSAAYDALVLLQVLLEAIAIILISIMAYHVSKKKIAFYLSLLILAGSLNITYWTAFILPESLGISFLIFFLYLYYRFTISKSFLTLVFSSVFLGLLVVLKPYYIFIYFLLFLEWIFVPNGRFAEKIYEIFRKAFLFGGILVLFLAPWIIRNYKVYQQFVPLQISIYAGINYSQAELAWRDYVTSWGGSIVHWDNNSAGCYFKPQEDIDCKFELPEKAIPPSYKRADIEKVRNDFITLRKSYDPVLAGEVERKFVELKNDMKERNPIQFHILSRLSLAKQLVVHSGSYYISAYPDSNCYNYYFELFIKLIQSASYYLTLILGMAGLVCFSIKNKIVRISLGVILMLFVVFSVVLRLSEWRYFMYSYYFLTLGTVLLLTEFIKTNPFLKKTFNL